MASVSRYYQGMVYSSPKYFMGVYVPLKKILRNNIIFPEGKK